MKKEDAIKLYKSKWWEDLEAKTIVGFQLFEKKLCMPFDLFHKALEDVLERPVFTHELGSSNVKQIEKEFLGEKEQPTFEEIINLIPADKRILISGE